MIDEQAWLAELIFILVQEHGMLEPTARVHAHVLLDDAKFFYGADSLPSPRETLLDDSD